MSSIIDRKQRRKMRKKNKRHKLTQKNIIEPSLRSPEKIRLGKVDAFL
jgi:hypothetical protein